MKFLKDIVNYLWKLMRSYIVLLGLLPWIYDFLQAYLVAFWPFLDGWTLPKIAIYGVFGLSFFVSGFLVWREEGKRVETLMKQLDFRVKYEVTYSIEELSPIDTTEIEKQIQNAEKEEAEDKGKEIFGIPSSTIALLEGMGYSRRTNSPESLKCYLDQVKKYNSQIVGIRRVFLSIQNAGSKYDECIAIRLTPSKDTKILCCEEVFDIEEPPEHPSDRKDFMTGFAANIIPPSRNPHAFHRDVEYSDNGTIDVEINRLRPKESARLVFEGFYVESKHFSFEVEITSKNLSEPEKFTVTDKSNQ